MNRTRISAALALLLAAAASAGTALGQATPAGNIALDLTPSTTSPPPGTDFTVDLSVDLSGATGSCVGSQPMALGGYSLGVQYDSSQLQLMGTGACPTAPVEFAAAPVCTNDTTTPDAAVVTCSGVNAVAGSAVTTPTGVVCVARLTFQNLTASSGIPATIQTVHTGGARGIATEFIESCAGSPAIFDGPVTDETLGGITPAVLTIFAAE